MTDDELSRRRLLVSSISLSALALAGCVGDDDDGTTADTDDSADDADDGSSDAEEEPADDAEEESADDDAAAIPDPLPTDPDDADFADYTGEDDVEIITREGDDGEPAFVFDPPFVRVDEGTTVRWVNRDGVFHTITSTDSLDSRSGGGDDFDATISSVGDEFEWAADEPGRQDYYCSPHASFMFGAIDVV